MQDQNSGQRMIDDGLFFASRSSRPEQVFQLGLRVSLSPDHPRAKFFFVFFCFSIGFPSIFLPFLVPFLHVKCCLPIGNVDSTIVLEELVVMSLDSLTLSLSLSLSLSLFALSLSLSFFLLLVDYLRK